MARRFSAPYLSEPVSGLATWARNLAVFSVVAVFVSILIVRFGFLEMKPALATFFGALALALAAGACTANITDAGHDGGNGPNGNPSGGSDPGGGGSTGSVPSVMGKLKLDNAPSYYRVVRLTNEQWTNSVQSVLGLASPPTLAEAFQDAVRGMTDFTNNELLLDVDNRGWSDFQEAAETLAAQVAADPTGSGTLNGGASSSRYRGICLAGRGRQNCSAMATALNSAEALLIVS